MYWRWRIKFKLENRTVNGFLISWLEAVTTLILLAWFSWGSSLLWLLGTGLGEWGTSPGSMLSPPPAAGSRFILFSSGIVAGRLRCRLENLRVWDPRPGRGVNLGGSSFLLDSGEDNLKRNHLKPPSLDNLCVRGTNLWPLQLQVEHSLTELHG